VRSIPGEGGRRGGARWEAGPVTAGEGFVTDRAVQVNMINQVRYFNITLTRLSLQLRHRGGLSRMIGAKDEPRNDVGVQIVVQKTFEATENIYPWHYWNSSAQNVRDHREYISVE
jgi:hypothetical protein